MSWDPINWKSLGERPPITPTIGGFVYPGCRHVWSGPPESAKTWAAFAVALDEIRAGNNVLHVDFEMFAHETRDRLRAMGATGDELELLLHVEPETEASEHVIGALADEWQPTLVIIDAAAGAYGVHGLDDNKRQDVELFSRVIIEPFRARDVATVVLDHVTKNSETRGRFSIGSERKVGGADVHLGFEPIVPFGRGRAGLFRIVTHKDRFGHLDRPNAAELELRSDPDTFSVTWQFRPPTATAADDGGFRPTALMEKISAYLERQTEPVPRTVVEENVTGRATYLRRAMDVLVLEQFVQERPGSYGARLLDSMRPFTASSSLVPSSSRLVPSPVVTSSSLVPPSTRGDEDRDDAEDEGEARPRALFEDSEPELAEAEA